MRLSALILCLLATPALSEDRAILIANETYSTVSRVSGATVAVDAEAALTAAGFRVITGTDQTTAALRTLLSDLIAQPIEDGRLVIVLSGHFATGAGQTWFLGTETDAADIATVGAQGIDLGSVLSIAARVPGGAIVMLGTEDRRLPLGPGLTPGIGALTPPQGVTLVQGDAYDIGTFAASGLPQRGISLAALLADTDFLASGFLAPLIPFRDGEEGVIPPRPIGPDGDDTLWQATEVIGTVDGYQAYLRRYPDGRHATAAKAAIARIQAEPQLEARLAEDALALTRAARRAIQEGLSLTGFDPKGIDGVFGAGSRTAITAWQRRYGHAPTSYLTREQIVQLSAQADRRRAELATEEAARQAVQVAEDRAYWDQTGKAGDEAGLRAYLRRYPDGAFADLATQRIKVIDDARAAEAAAADRAAWDTARAGNTVASYTQYLTDHPDGGFVDQARARIAALDGSVLPVPGTDAAQSAELALQLSPIARTLIEGRLSSLGLNPGPVDGRFDAASRRAIGAFQQSRDLPVTGFLDNKSMVALMAGGVLDLPN
jgi:peptidoglycan hydrolase-like protein with peptidoglycan-binding domain